MTRHSLRLFFALICFLTVGTTCAAADPTPAEIVDQAIKATGGTEAIAKQKAMTWTENGTYHGGGMAQQFQGNYASEMPNKFSMEIVGVFKIVFDGERGWLKTMGNVAEMSDEQIAEQRENVHASWASTLVPLKGKEFTVAAAGEGKVDGRPALAIKVSYKGRRDVTLSFDKETHLLAKIESVVKSEEQGGKEVKQEILFSDYQEVGHVKLPRKYAVLRDGQKFVESEMSNASILDKHAEGTFGKPE